MFSDPEDGDFPEDWLKKITSYKRYRQNHVLMKKILNEEMVGDFRDIPTKAQLKAMEKQRDGLQGHKVPSFFLSPQIAHATT